MDRHTDRPDGSGGAAPTVVTTLPGHDELAIDDDLALDGETVANGAAKNGVGTARDVSEAADHAGRNGHDTDGGTGAAPADYDFVPALPADTIGLPRGSQPNRYSAPTIASA